MSTWEAAQADAKRIAHAILPSPVGGPGLDYLADQPGTAPAPVITPRRQAGYGLPCAKCKTYYSADLNACPVCQTSERVSPTAGTSAEALGAPEIEFTDTAKVEEERERFLRDFKSQVEASRLEINAVESFRCSRSEHHPGGFEPATVCQGCFDQVQARLDLMEAALHIELKEAASVVYDAVWSDPSDPSKTYVNAAQALLLEMRNRAGIKSVLGSLQTKSH